MIELDHKSLLALFYDVESGMIVIQRYNVEGQLLNCDEATFAVERSMLQEDEGEVFERQPDGTYVVKCVCLTVPIQRLLLSTWTYSHSAYWRKRSGFLGGKEEFAVYSSIGRQYIVV